MCEHTGTGVDDDTQEPYLPTDSTELSGYPVTFNDGQELLVYPRIEQPPHVVDGLYRMLKVYKGKAATPMRQYVEIKMTRLNNAIITKLINDNKLIYCLPYEITQ